MEYIETELAKRRREDHADTFLDADQDNEEEEEDDEGSEDDDDEGAKSGVGSRLKQKKAAGSGAAAHRRLPPRQPAALGRLHEIDLGPDATLRNIARTEAATRQLGGGEEAADIEEGTDKARPRGKKKKGSRPWKKRRTSEDIKRDKLVEEVLRESRLEIYDDPEPLNNAQDDEQAADDRIAEQFRRDFMDAVSSRQRRRAVPASNSTATKGAKKDERPKGPKLGGSRSARAAMRELQEKAKR
ncbi:MAG: hypothetical protein M1837_003487 [Sclerophora amabilis]|nr:MAG: hypothetical protein M1837_003487 [Sclerophora amabilis]